jgi:hypothetical protein
MFVNTSEAFVRLGRSRPLRRHCHITGPFVLVADTRLVSEAPKLAEFVKGLGWRVKVGAAEVLQIDAQARMAKENIRIISSLLPQNRKPYSAENGNNERS